MLVTATLPPDSGLRVEGVAVADDTVLVVVVATREAVPCPICGQHARRVHSRFRRGVADLPWQGVSVRLALHTRRFFCDEPTCPRTIFAERFPGLVGAGARRSERLTTLYLAVSLALGGEAGRRMAAEMGLRISPDTLLRLATATAPPAAPTPRVLGVDDWAWRRGRRWGTILVDLERHCPIDLLPDRTAETLAQWLRTHPGVELVTRDRAGAYAEGIRQGAPDAVQIADRFHLVKNAGEALERVLQRHHQDLRRAATAVDQTARAAAEPVALGPPPTTSAQPPAPSSRAQLAKTASRDRRLAHYDAVLELHRRGVSLREIARQLGLGRDTVRRFVRADGFPERAERVRRPTSLTPYEPYLRERWTAGCQNARQLYDAIRAAGFRGSVSLVRHEVAAWRTSPGRPGRPARQDGPPTAPTPPVRPPTRVLSARQARWLLVKEEAELEPAQRVYLAQLRQDCPAIVAAEQLTREFGRLLRERDQSALAPWLAAATTSGLPEFGELARGIERDRAAVEAALQYAWSNGQTEAQVLQLKALRRQMRGRGGFALVRRRVVRDGPVSRLRGQAQRRVGEAA